MCKYWKPLVMEIHLFEDVLTSSFHVFFSFSHSLTHSRKGVVPCGIEASALSWAEKVVFLLSKGVKNNVGWSCVVTACTF